MGESLVHELLSGLRVAGRSRRPRKPKADRSAEAFDETLRKELSEAPQVIIYTRRPYGNYGATFMSQNIVSQLGYKPESFVENSLFWQENIHPDDVREVEAGIARLFETGHWVHEYRFRCSDGSYRWMRDELNLIRDEAGNPCDILGTWIDVTRQKMVERALRESEARYRSLVETSPVGMVSFDKNGEITEFNPAVLRILGAPLYKAAEAKDLFSLLPLVEAGISEAILQCLESGESNVGEFQYKSKSDRQVYTRLYVVPIRGGDGGITGAHAFVQDISDQKRAEELIVGSERLKVLGQISTGVGHHFNNLLQVVSGNAQMALTSLELGEYEAVRGSLEQILDGSRSATGVVKWLQQFARGKAHTSQLKEVVELPDVVTEAVEICKLWSSAELERKRIQIIYELELDKGCHVEGVPDQLAWVLLNLLKNSVEAMPGGGKIKIKGHVREEQVLLQVHDNGIGIPAHQIRNITEAFWTSKERHSGMGLAFSAGIIRQHGGTMGVKRMRPHGTTFVIRLPHVKDPVEKRKALEAEASAGGRRVLLIDDDERVVRVFEEGLKQLGQKPMSATSGQQGLNLFEETDFDAVVCDLAMTGMNGWDVAAAIRDRCTQRGVPKPPFIMLTGWARQLDEAEIVQHPEVERIVQKPVTVPGLIEIIDEEIIRSAPKNAFSGRVEGIDILEYIQLLILSGKPVVVEVVPRSGGRGLLFLDKGRVLHAVFGELVGEEALYQCLNFGGGSFVNLPWYNPETVTIDKPGDYILIEAARRRDEIKAAEQKDWGAKTDNFMP